MLAPSHPLNTSRHGVESAWCKKYFASRSSQRRVSASIFSANHALRAPVKLMSPSDFSVSRFLASMQLPRQRKCFHVTEIFDRFDHAFLDAQPAVLDSSERRILDAKPWNFVHIDRAAFEF